MPEVRISGNWRNVHKMELAGTSILNKNGQLERSLEIPDEAYLALEHAIAKGENEGTVYLLDRTRFDYFVDR